MIEYSLSTAALAAHLKIAPKKDVRFYLCGVFLDTTAGRLVSTDGSCMLITSHPELKSDAAPVIIPRGAIESALKAAGKRASAVTLEVAAGNVAALTFRPAAGIAQSCAAVDGRFPDYARVVPASVSGEAGNYDPSLLARIGDALQVLGGCRTQLAVRTYMNGANQAAWVMLDSSTTAVPHVAVIMPCRPKSADTLETASAAVNALMMGAS